MLGEYQDLKALREVIDQYDDQYPEGVWLVVDDAHGVGAFGPTGRGTEEMSGAQADVLIGTYGKAFGADGGYVTADETVIAYLRESAATYIYSNSISPGNGRGSQESAGNDGFAGRATKATSTGKECCPNERGAKTSRVRHGGGFAPPHPTAVDRRSGKDAKIGRVFLPERHPGHGD